MKLNKKKIVIFSAVVTVVAAISYSVHSLNTPATGTVSQNSPAEEKTPEKKTISGKYIDFQYPARFAEASNANQTASLEYWILVSRLSQGAGQTGQISVIITNLPEGGVKEDSSYKNVHAFTDKYKLNDTTYNNEPVSVATRTDPSYERTALWPHKKLLLTATVTSSTQNDQLDKEFNDLLSSVQWQP